MRCVWRNVNPGDHYGMSGINLIVVREGPVDVLGGSTQDIRSGVLPEENLPHARTGVQIAMKGRNHPEGWRHFAQICRLARRLFCGNKTIGVDLKSNTQLGHWHWRNKTRL